MEFEGTFQLEATTVDEVWLGLSDPVLIADALPGCQFLLHVEDESVDFDDLAERAADRDAGLTADPAVVAGRAFEEGERYAALIQVSVGPVNPTFETVVTIDERERPRMRASGEGSSGDSSFELSSGMELSEGDDGVEVSWEAEADVFGKVAGMGQRVIDPVANRVVKRFFSSVQSKLDELALAEADGSATAPEESDGRGTVDRLLGRSNAGDTE